jgi:hypothetical protein
VSVNRGRLAVAGFLLGILIVLLCDPSGNVVARIFVTLLALSAVVALAMAAQAGYLERRPPDDLSPPFPPQPVDLPRPYAPAGVSPPRLPAYDLTAEPQSASVPRFGRGSRTQQLPWRLPAQPSPVPGIVADEAELGALTVRAASLVGPGHRCADPAEMRQDAYRLGRDATGEYLVVAVADGLSSSGRSDLGATVAVSSAVTGALELLRSGFQPDPQWAPKLFSAVAQRIRDEAATRGLSDRDVCTVLIVTILPTRLPENEPRFGWVGWLGDVSLWLLAEGGWRQAAGNRKQDEGGYASNALDAVLPHDPGAAQSRQFQFGRGDVLTLVTDGVGDGLAGLPPLNDLLARRWATPPAITDFISHVGFDAEQFTDDRSAVTVWAGTARSQARSRWPR